MRLTWKHTGPAREPAIEVPEVSIGNYGHVLVHDPKRKCIVYVRAKDYGGELEASTWNGVTWTRQQGRGRITGDETHGFYDTARAGVAMWSCEHSHTIDRITPNGVLVTDGKIQSIKTKGDHPLIEPDREESFFLSSSRGLLATLTLLALVACGSKAGDAKPEPGPTADAAVLVPAKPKEKEKEKARPKPTKAQLDELKKRMQAGMALQKASKWAESVPEFEAALVAVPDDQRALAELGWSAMLAGDFVKARKADEAAIRVAVDKNVKAAGLYNLGQVQEKTGDKVGAQKSFSESLKLRPHPVVETALAALGAKPGVELPFCAKGAKPCDCIFEHAFDENQKGTAATCTQAKPGSFQVKSFTLYTVASEAYYGSKWTYLLDEANQLVDIVFGEAERTRLFEKTTLDKTDVKTIAGRWVLWLETTRRSSVTLPSEDDEMIIEEWSAKSVTICVIGDAKTSTRCPLRDVPLLQRTEKGTTTTETHLEVTIADDGTATVKLIKGPSDAQIGKLVGPHRLW